MSRAARHDVLDGVLVFLVVLLTLLCPIAEAWGTELDHHLQPTWCVSYECGCALQKVQCAQPKEEKQAWCRPGRKTPEVLGVALDSTGRAYLTVRGRTHARLALFGEAVCSAD